MLCRSGALTAGMAPWIIRAVHVSHTWKAAPAHALFELSARSMASATVGSEQNGFDTASVKLWNTQ